MIPLNFKKAPSFNRESVAGLETKLLIVGTITPPETGYFYCTKYNRIFGYLDQFLHMNLKSLKPNPSDPDFKKDRQVAEIKKTIRGKGVAFLDVIDTAVRKQKKLRRQGHQIRHARFQILQKNRRKRGRDRQQQSGPVRIRGHREKTRVEEQIGIHLSKKRHQNYLG